MDAFVAKVRSFKNKLQRQRCLELGFIHTPISDHTIKLIDEVNHYLTIAQLDTFGVVSNVTFENGRKVVL